MVRRIRVAVVGCGAVAQTFHIPTLMRMSEAELKMVVDVDKKRILEAMRRLRFNCTESTDYHIALEDKNIDCVFLLTPPKFHRMMITEAAEAGKDIFCEKPIALNLGEAKEIVKCIQKAHVKLMIGFNGRFVPQFRRIKRLIDRGFLGNPIGASSVLFRDVSSWPSESGFQFTSEGGGALFETGCHHIDLIRWYLGDVRRVFAQVRKTEKRLQVDDTASVIMEFANGAVSTTTVGWRKLNVNKLEVFGDNAYLEAAETKNEVRFLGKGFVAQAPIRIRVKKVISSFHEEFRHFFDCIRREKEPLVNELEGYKTLEATIAAYESSAKGVPIILS